jgi:hypothetical protein
MKHYAISAATSGFASAAPLGLRRACTLASRPRTQLGQLGAKPIEAQISG